MKEAGLVECAASREQVLNRGPKSDISRIWPAGKFYARVADFVKSVACHSESFRADMNWRIGGMGALAFIAKIDAQATTRR